MAVSAAGCSNEANVAPAPPKPFASATVRVAVPDNPTPRALIERHGRDWTAVIGARVELVPASAAADVRVFRPGDAGRIAGGLARFDLRKLKAQQGYQFSDILRHQTDCAMDWGGEPIALPLLGESLVCVYRADLLEDARHVAGLTARFADRLHRPYRTGRLATWQEVREVAAYFAGAPSWTSGESHATPRPSLPALPAAAAELDRDFHAAAASFVREGVTQARAATLDDRRRRHLFFTYQFDVDSGAPAINSPGFAAALRLLQELQPYRVKGTAERPLEAFRSGQAVVALATLADVAWLQQEGSAVRGKFAACRVPGSEVVASAAAGQLGPSADQGGNFVPYVGHGGWVGGLDASAANAAAARDLLEYLSGPRVSLEIACEPAWGGGPTRASHLDNRPGWHNYGLTAARTAQLIEALDGYYRAPALNSARRLRLAREEEFVQVFADKVRPALAEGKPADRALQEVADAWAELGKDRAALLREYQQSQGLHR